MTAAAQIDKVQVFRLASIACTIDEIAAFCCVSARTIERRCKTELTRGRKIAEMSLRRKQFEKAVKEGNVTMLIWLGKQMLGQKDRVEVDNLNGKNTLDLARVRKLLKGKSPDEPADAAGRD